MNKTVSRLMSLAPGLWVLGNYYFNLYLVKGEQGTVLIEAGVSAVVDQVIQQLESLRLIPTFIVVTHAHADHVTGLSGLREKYPQVLVVAGEGAPEFLSHPKGAKAIITEDKHMSGFLSSQGLPPGRTPLEDPPTLENCLIARDGDEMHLGGLTLRYLCVKGHAPGNLVIYIPEAKSLIASDSLGFRYPGRGFFPLFLTGYSDYLVTIDRLHDLHPEILGPAHQGFVMGNAVENSFRESREQAVHIRKTILTDTRDPEEIAQDLFEKYYRDECKMYTPGNIMNCARLLVQRTREE